MLLKNAQLLNDRFEWETGDLRIYNGKIAEIGPNLTEDGETLDCTGLHVTPGLIDVHTHGAVGTDYSRTNPAAIAQALRFEAQHGVTAVLPTMMTMPEAMIADALHALREYLRAPDETAAWVPGAHMEGPFFSMSKRGAQPAEWIAAPDMAMLRRLNPDGLVRLIAVAPETDGALDFIREAARTMTVSVGHTAADYETACAAFAAGATEATHLYNGMTGATHRAPGVVGAVWDTAGVNAELISDGRHVHPAIVRATFRLLGRHVMLISDSLVLTGMAEGTQGEDVAGHHITVRNGRCELDDGTIAGSITPLDECVRRAISFGIAPADAFFAASMAPARAVKLDGETGSLTPGKRADILVTDAAYRPRHVFVGGVPVPAAEK